MESNHRISRILILDDHPLVRIGLTSLIQNEEDLCICAEAETEREARERIVSTEPDLAVVDLTLAAGSGMQLISWSRTTVPALRLLVCSMHDDALFAERVLRAGAHGYINKQEASTHVVEAIRWVLSGRIWLNRAMSERLLHNGALVADSGRRGIESLSNRELEVFTLIGQGFKPSRIAERLGLSVKTVDAHRENIKKKLRLASGAELVRHATIWLSSAE